MWFAYQLQGIPSEPTVPGDAYGQRIVFLAQLRARQVELDRGRIRPVRRVGPLDAQTFGQGLLQLPAIEGDLHHRWRHRRRHLRLVAGMNPQPSRMSRLGSGAVELELGRPGAREPIRQLARIRPVAGANGSAAIGP